MNIHMSIHQEKHSIRNMQVISSICAHSTHRFFCLEDKRFPMLIIKKNEEEKFESDRLKLRVFWGFVNDYILSSESYTATKVEYLLNKSSDLYEILNLSSQDMI